MLPRRLPSKGHVEPRLHLWSDRSLGTCFRYRILKMQVESNLLFHKQALSGMRSRSFWGPSVTRGEKKSWVSQHQPLGKLPRGVVRGSSVMYDICCLSFYCPFVGFISAMCAHTEPLDVNDQCLGRLRGMAVIPSMICYCKFKCGLLQGDPETWNSDLRTKSQVGTANAAPTGEMRLRPSNWTIAQAASFLPMKLVVQTAEDGVMHSPEKESKQRRDGATRPVFRWGFLGMPVTEAYSS